MYSHRQKSFCVQQYQWGKGRCDGRPVAYILMGEGLYQSSSMPFCTDMPSFQDTSLSIPWMMMAYHLCILPLGCVRLIYHIRHAGPLPPVSTGLPVMPTESTKPVQRLCQKVNNKCMYAICTYVYQKYTYIFEACVG